MFLSLNSLESKPVVVIYPFLAIFEPQLPNIANIPGWRDQYPQHIQWQVATKLRQVRIYTDTCICIQCVRIWNYGDTGRFVDIRAMSRHVDTQLNSDRHMTSLQTSSTSCCKDSQPCSITLSWRLSYSSLFLIASFCVYFLSLSLSLNIYI